MNRQLNVAVLGCGRMGEVHGEAYAGLPDESRVFYASRDPDRATGYANRFGGVGVFGEYQEAIQTPDIDLVDICLPDHLHAATAEAAFAAGKHVLVEKPMATSLADADRMIRAGERAGRTLTIAENFRFLPHLERAKELVAESALGEIFLIEVNHFESLHPRGWRTQTTDDAGGTLIDVGHHFVDMAVQLGGPVDWVFAQFAQRTLRDFTGEDTAVVMLGYASGVIGHLAVTIGAPGAPPQPTFIVCGTKASLYFDWQSGLWTGEGRAWSPSTLVLAKAPEPPDSFDYWGVAIHAMVRSVVSDLRAGLAPRITGDIGRHDLALILAARQSARTREVVAVAHSADAQG